MCIRDSHPSALFAGFAPGRPRSAPPRKAPQRPRPPAPGGGPGGQRTRHRCRPAAPCPARPLGPRQGAA
eukprot:6319001-Lingulodinium_polyedra.AAC.1